MPKAVRFNATGGPEVLKLVDVASREPGTNEVKLRVEAVGLNRAESMYYHGQYLEQPQLPSGLGYEAVGVVTAVGPEGDTSLLGKRFGTIPGYSMNQFPVLAEEAIVPVHVLAEFPDSFSSVQGAAVWMQYATAYGALVVFGNVTKGDFVLITAASSSVGLAAIQIANAEGATPIATTRTAAKKAELLELGAAHVIVTEDEDLPARVMEISGGKGAHIVFDPVAGPFVETLAKATADEGTIFVYGLLSGQPTPFPLMQTLPRNIKVAGYTLLSLSKGDRTAKAKEYIFDGLQTGRFTPKIARTFPFAEFQEAYRYLESNQQVGKVVITVP